VDGYMIFGPKERVVLLCTVPGDQPCHDIPTITTYFISYSGWMLFSLYFPGYCMFGYSEICNLCSHMWTISCLFLSGCGIPGI